MNLKLLRACREIESELVNLFEGYRKIFIKDSYLVETHIDKEK